jgi:hypothetical protein
MEEKEEIALNNLVHKLEEDCKYLKNKVREVERYIDKRRYIYSTGNEIKIYDIFVLMDMVVIQMVQQILNIFN